MGVKSHSTGRRRGFAGATAAILLGAWVGVGLGAAERSDAASSPAESAAASPDQPSGAVEGAGTPPELAARVDRLITELGDPDYAVRRAAQEELKALPIEAGRRLLAHYRRTDDAEVRMRIELYAEHFFREHVLPKHLPPPPGFLGVQLQPGVGPTGRAAARIARVLPGTAADQAGLRANDLIVGFRGRPLPADDPVRTLIEGIRELRAGEAAQFTIQRGEAVFEPRITLGRRGPDLQEPEQREQLEQFRAALRERWWREAFLTGRLTLPPEAPASEMNGQRASSGGDADSSDATPSD
jgi:hypothetical protein